MAGGLKEEQILAETFPDNVSISDLCDCGRHKRRKEQMPKPRQRLKSFPETDYARTFKAHMDFRPRSSKRPPPSPREKNPPKMSFETNQRRDFQPPDKVGRPPDFAPKEHYSAPSVPVEKMTYYTTEFTPKEMRPEIRKYERAENIRRTSAKFEGRTTYQEQHKSWVGPKQLAFGELPSFAGSILFPKKDKETWPDSETKQSFTGEFAKRPDLIRLADSNIKTEGPMDLLTTNNLAYKNIPGDFRRQMMVREPVLTTSRIRGKFSDDTQFKHDFPEYSTMPERRKPAEPAPDTLDLKFDNKRSFDTEQRTIYRGHDVLKNPIPQSCKLEDEMYKPPQQAMESETSQKRDYRPIDLERSYKTKPVVPVQRVHASDVKFDDHTMFKEFFKDWGVSPRVRHGDFHENRPYMPPQMKFEGESVTKASFIPKKAEPVKDFKPEQKPMAREGGFDFNTVTNMTYKTPVVKPCRAAVYLMQKELKRQREVQGKPSSGAQTRQPIAAK